MTLAGALRRIREPFATILTQRASEGRLHRLYRDAHSRALFCGMEWEKHVPHLQRLVPELDQQRVLDYGCGPLGGLAGRFPNVISYDPHVPAYQIELPDVIDGLVSIDVLEHLTYGELARFFAWVQEQAPQWIYFTISHRKAKLRLPNGANAHLVVRSEHWWLKQLRRGLPDYRMVEKRSDRERNESSLFLELR